MSHLVYDGLVTVANLGSEFDASANPIVLKLDPTISKLPSGALKANVSGAIAAGTTNLTLNGGAPINLLPAIKAGETLTTMAYDPILKKITYTGENGTPIIVDLSALATDVFITGSNYDPATMVLTLTDNSVTTPDIILNLAELKKVATSNSPSVSFTGTGEASSPLIATVTSIPAGVTLSPSQISPGTFPTGVITPAANIGAGPLPAATTIAPAQITAGALPATVTVPGGNITGVITPTVMTDSTTHVNKWTKAGGVTESVNGVPSDLPIPKAVLEDVLGYDIKGLPSWESKASFAGTLTIGAGQIGPGTLGAGVVVPPANLGAGPLPATTTVPGGNITGVITPAVMTASTTNTLAVTGPNLVSTVNGVAASVPMASIVPATTHVNTWTKSSGLKESVNGVASDIPIVAGTIVDTLGYNAAGLTVYQPVVAPVTVTDNANGTVTVNAGVGQTQTMIRPIDEQTPSAILTAADKFTVLDNGTLDHRSITLVEFRRRLQNEIAVADTLVNAPGGVIPATRTVEGVVTPIDTYVDYDGSHSATIILPAPVHNGQRLVFNHLASLNTTVAVTNSSMTSPLVVTAAMGGAEWIAINGKWHLTTERPAVFPTVVTNTATAPAGAYTVPAQTVVGLATTYTNLVLIPQASPITIPAPAAYPKNTELYLKTTGTWTGSLVLTPAGGQIDGAATYTFNKASATLKPSITVMHDGTNWYVV